MIRKNVKWLSCLMAVLMCLSMFPQYAAATGADDPAAELDSTGYIPAGETPALVNVIDPGEGDDPAPTETTAPEEPTETELPAPTETPEEPDGDATEELGGDPEEVDDAELDGDPEESFTVSYYSDKTGGTLLKSETVQKGASPKEIPADDGAGRTISVWLDADGAVVDVAKASIEADTAFYAWYRPALNYSDHTSYIKGTGNACFSPDTDLTRKQAAQILYSLLDTTELGPYPCTFTDVSNPSSWYYEPVRVLASYGVINGDGNGKFRPNDAVSRAEFVTMLVRLTGVSGGSQSFTDVKSTHWSAPAIGAASSLGWVSGYGDGTFRPTAPITRAQAVKVVNRVLGRQADTDKIATGSGILHFIDVPLDQWYYPEVMEAAIGHEHTTSAGLETWTSYTVVKTGLSQGVHAIGGALCCIDSNEQPVYMEAGINNVDGKFYYAKSTGYTCDAELNKKAGYAVFADGTEQKLADRFNRIGSTLFYWNLSSATARALAKGLNLNLVDANGNKKSYWAEKAGYNIFTDFGTGAKVVTLDGKKYLTDGYCAIITTTWGYPKAAVGQTLQQIDLKDRTYELVDTNGSDIGMYYIQSDYTIATSAWKGYLYFGSNGKYTSGDTELDNYVWNIVKGFINNSGLTPEAKLLKAYYSLRGGEGATYVSNGFYYSKLNPVTHQWLTILGRKRYNEKTNYPQVIKAAKEMYYTYTGRDYKHYGMCHQWGSAYLFLARRLGFQAYVVSGGVWSSGNDHCWVMVQWDGKWHISDVELEWGHLCGYYQGGKIYRNLFDQTVASENITYYKSTVCDISYYFPS